MEKSLSFPIASAIAALLFSAAAFAALDVPAGTEIQLRLKTKVSTQTSKADDPVEAVVIAPVMAGSEFAIPAGAIVRGVVQKVSASTGADQRAVLELNFTELEIAGAKSKIAAQVFEVENAREKVDDNGQINGILTSDTITGKLDSEITKVADRYSTLGGILGAAKGAVLKPAQNDITYDAGVELDVKLTAPLSLPRASDGGPAAKVQAIADEDGLLRLVSHEPFQTMAQQPSKPSDITNLMIIASQEQLQQAFQDAGWSNAAALSGKAKFETLQALAEDRGYNEAPVSVLLLDGKPPDIVFEKMNNTFAHRHHLRIWRRPETFHGQTVWDVAATHDTGINFSEQNRTFIHRIDSQIDRERAKVVNDLIFTGRVQAIALVDRDNIPKNAQNATGDNLETDGKLAVLVLK